MLPLLYALVSHFLEPNAGSKGISRIQGQDARLELPVAPKGLSTSALGKLPMDL